MAKLVNPFQLLEMGAEILLSGDIKFFQLAIGIKTGNSSYPCVWCNWRMTGQTCDPVQQLCAPSDVAKDVAEFIRLGSNRNKSSCYHGQQGIPKGVNYFRPEIFVPPALHINLGLVNPRYPKGGGQKGTNFF